jgi:hypothetical protein
MRDEKKKWKVVFLGPSGEVYADTNAFKQLYPFPTLAEADAHAKMLLAVGMKVAFTDEHGNIQV